MKKTLYEILDIDRRASPDDIAAAYRKRLAALDGDAGSDDGNLRILLHEAREILSNPGRRLAYDKSLAAETWQASPRQRPDRAPVLRSWGAWVGGAAALAGLGLWFLYRPATSPPPITETPIVSSEEKVEARSVEPPEPARDPITRETPAPSPATASADASPAGALSARPAEEIFAQVAPSVARINVLDATGQLIGVGSGVVIDNGVVITACHVAKRGAKLAAKVGDVTIAATLQVADEALDLCRLNVPGLRAPPATIGSAATLRPGQTVYAIGAPAGLELTISQGIVSGLRKVDEGTVIQTSTPISQGSSGGGLFDSGGRLVGVTTFQHRFGQNLNFALPADWIAQMRPREAPADSVARRTLALVPESSPSSLIIGQWLCRDWISGQSGQYRFEPDGNLSIATSDGRTLSLIYRVSGKALLLSDAKYGGSLAIQELSERRLVIHGGDRSLACER